MQKSNNFLGCCVIITPELVETAYKVLAACKLQACMSDGKYKSFKNWDFFQKSHFI